jgi:hypothetical protein
MLNRVLSLTVAAALVLFVGAAFAADKDKDAKPADDTHAGTFISFADGKLVMNDDKGKEMTHTLAKDAKVTIDGKEAKPDDLKLLTKGAPLTVTVDKDKAVALKVDAKSK